MEGKDRAAWGLVKEARTAHPRRKRSVPRLREDWKRHARRLRILGHAFRCLTQIGSFEEKEDIDTQKALHFGVYDLQYRLQVAFWGTNSRLEAWEHLMLEQVDV